MRNVWPLLLLIASGIATFVLGTRVEPNALNVLTSAVLVSTLIAVVWYTIETRSLRLQQEFDSEIRNHPWLKGSSLSVEWKKDEGGLLGREIIYLPVTNVGTTPAHDLNLGVWWELKGGLPRQGERKFRQLVLAPNDTNHVNLCEIDYDDPSDMAAIEVEISYKSFKGGGGYFKMSFLKESGKGWANGPMSPYEFWLSDGRRFPVSGHTTR